MLFSPHWWEGFGAVLKGDTQLPLVLAHDEAGFCAMKGNRFVMAGGFLTIARLRKNSALMCLDGGINKFLLVLEPV